MSSLHRWAGPSTLALYTTLWPPSQTVGVAWSLPKESCRTLPPSASARKRSQFSAWSPEYTNWPLGANAKPPMPSHRPEVTCLARSGASDAPTQIALAEFRCTDAIIPPSREAETDKYWLRSLETRRTTPLGYDTIQSWAGTAVRSSAESKSPLPSGSQVKSLMARQRLPATGFSKPVATSNSVKVSLSPWGSFP